MASHWATRPSWGGPLLSVVADPRGHAETATRLVLERPLAVSRHRKRVSGSGQRTPVGPCLRAVQMNRQGLVALE